MNAAMILSECINESKQEKKPLIIAALDVQKAFDVVNHDSLLRKLYLDGFSGDDCLLMKDIYTGMTAKVKWDGFLSSPFTIKQGVRRGGILSASHCKRYNNPLIIDVEDRFTGKKIGTVRIPHTSVADEMCFVTEDRSEVQPTLRKRLRIHSVISVNYHYITVLCPFN